MARAMALKTSISVVCTVMMLSRSMGWLLQHFGQRHHLCSKVVDLILQVTCRCRSCITMRNVCIVETGTVARTIPHRFTNSSTLEGIINVGWSPCTYKKLQLVLEAINKFGHEVKLRLPQLFPQLQDIKIKVLYGRPAKFQIVECLHLCDERAPCIWTK